MLPRRTPKVLGARARAFSLTVWLLALVVASVVHPSITRAESASPRRIAFLLHAPASALAVLGTFDSIRGQLGELHLDIVAAHAPYQEDVREQAERAAELARQQRADATLWFDEASPGTIRIYALHAASGRVFARDVALDSETAVQREQLAVVLRSTIPAVLEGAAELGDPVLVIGDKRQANAARPVSAGAPIRDAASDETLDSPTRLGVALGYAGTAIARDASFQNGVAAALLVDRGAWLRAGAGLGYAAPVTIAAAGARAVVTRIPIFALLGARLNIGAVSAGVEAGPALEAWYRRTEIDSAGLRATEPSVTWRLGTTAALRFEAPLGARLGLYFSLEGQWFPAPHRVSVQSNATTRTVSTASLRPQVGAGLTFDVVRAPAQPPVRKTSTSLGASGH